jgi:hypothetical protein
MLGQVNVSRDQRPVTQLPAKPDFSAMEAVAHASADRRTLILALIGNLAFSWSNNESMLIYMIMLLMKTDETSAKVVFATLNTTRARVDLVQRLAALKLSNPVVSGQLDAILRRFNKCTAVRNELNHCMFILSPEGEITHTHSMRIHEEGGRVQLGSYKKLDDKRVRRLLATIEELRMLNREIWEFLPALEASTADSQAASQARQPAEI